MLHLEIKRAWGIWCRHGSQEGTPAAMKARAAWRKIEPYLDGEEASILRKIHEHARSGAIGKATFDEVAKTVGEKKGWQ